ncbi:hypothetical protein ZYGR_0AF02470 [Zygosaccharomyces rouxii]|uniref:Protein farnesyltransferase subunit beta n=1 Tax=Zygosaccharomyces rouxii TaxID=4956 RepID=A0A1Q3A7R1_ZYGRO|nr:hypothetical protein ZYGR_0AF02470 [Zygosaccharomyces rouxii]
MSNQDNGLKNPAPKLLGRKRSPIERVVPSEEESSSESEQSIVAMVKEMETETTEARDKLIHQCRSLLEGDELKILDKEFHKRYLDAPFSHQLPPGMVALDASAPWLLYWVANGLRVMNQSWLETGIQRRIQEKVFRINPRGGPFGGGVGQLPHLAGTYAITNALAICDNVDGCWDKINRSSIYDWLLSLKREDGGFQTCLGVGEYDTRGIYCAISVASTLGLLTQELCENVVEFLVHCQNYEGGFGGVPHEDEAHGGYTFCAVASLAILGALDRIDVEKLADWCSQRQYNDEKGLSGRSNKLVDVCYSFWVGGTAAILEAYGYRNCIDKAGLKEYILKCCQMANRPGIRDKPGTRPDFYHTNYGLLGVAITENSFQLDPSVPNALKIESSAINSNENSGLEPINPVYGLPSKDLEKFYKHFK